MSNKNKWTLFFTIVVISYIAILYRIYQLDKIEKNNAIEFCKYIPIECDCKVSAKVVGFGQYSHVEYYVTYKQNGQNITKEF